MKILYVITSTDTGGAEKALAAVVRQIAKKNCVRVISLKPCGPVATELKQAGAEVISFNMTGIGVKAVFLLRKEIQAFRPDIVHALLFRAIEISRLACLLQPCKLLTTPHFDWAKKNILFRLPDKILCRIDFLTVAESAYTADFLVKKQHYSSKKVICISNSPQKNTFSPLPDVRLKMRRKYGYTQNQFIFINVARLAAEKNQLTLLKAFYQTYLRHPEIRLIIVGEGKERAVLEDFIAKHSLQKSVLLVGKQDNINDWLNLADVFVLPSKEEVLPLCLLEALQAGKPCIAGKVGDISNWVHHGKNGFLVQPKDPVLLSCFLEELATQPKTVEEMSQHSLEIGRKMQDNPQQYEQLYQQIKEDKFSRENF